MERNSIIRVAIMWNSSSHRICLLRSFPRRFSSSLSNLEYCVNLVKKHDFENYLTGLLVPASHRNAFFAVRAFNVEIATIRDQVPRNTRHAGRIRFQYWRDILNDVFSQSKSLTFQSPVGSLLSEAVKDHSLSARWFERTLDARWKDSMQSGIVFATMDELEDYVEYSHSSILYLILEVFDIRDDDAMYIASHAGVGAGIMSLLRGIQHHNNEGIIYFPDEVMRRHGLSSSALLKGPMTDTDMIALCDATNDVARQAQAHLARSRILYEDRGKRDAGVYAYTGTIGASQHLEILNDKGFDPFFAAAALQYRGIAPFALRLLKTTLTKKM